MGAILSDLSADPSYLYKTEVRDVVDADALLLDIDLGFEVIRRQRIRLARIDAPARSTPEGAQGRRFVREQLAVARIVLNEPNANRDECAIVAGEKCDGG